MGSLTTEEINKVIEGLGRTPTPLEIAAFELMWSEHCSYKSSKHLLRHLPSNGDRVVQGQGENAGIVSVDGDICICMKIESHNHPSAIDPYQGSATGVGGIIRDIFAMGARPVAILDSLRFGDLCNQRNRWLFSQVINGIADYGNRVGIPTVGGEVVFDDAYKLNPLVNVMCVGLVRKDDIIRGIAKNVESPVVLVGAATGRDGIGGAIFASDQLGCHVCDRRAIQIGDPFMEKCLMEACLEAYKTKLVEGVQDLGAGGVLSAACEMAARGEKGMKIFIDNIPRRENGMTISEILLSESQERMLLVIRKGAEHILKDIFQRWGLTYSVIGEVTNDGYFRVYDGEKEVLNIRVDLLTKMCPEKRYEKKTVSFHNTSIPPCPDDMGSVLQFLLGVPSISSKRWIFEQYDYTIGTNTVVGPGADAAVIRIRGTNKAIAITTDGKGSVSRIDPKKAGILSVIEATRNLTAVGATPIAVTDCLNLGNPETFSYALEEMVKGIAEACVCFGLPVVSGNVSFHNETDGYPIIPTPVIGMAGLIEDLSHIRSPVIPDENQALILLGRLESSLSGSAYLQYFHHVTGGDLPDISYDDEINIQNLCREGIRAGLITSVHDISDGGLLVALAEMCILSGIGAKIVLDNGVVNKISRPDTVLFGEDSGRIICTCPINDVNRLLKLAERFNCTIHVIGVARGSHLQVVMGKEMILEKEVRVLKKVWEQAIPNLMNF